MKIRIVFAIVLVASLPLLAGCLVENDDGGQVHIVAYESRYAAMNDVVDSSNEFSFDLYRELSKEDGNIFFSPYSVAIALGMAYEGAQGNTASQMRDVIDLPEDDSDRREMVLALQSLLNPDGANYELSTANAFWLRSGEKLNDIYKDVIEKYYLATGQQLDFVNDRDGAAETINKWVEEETNGKIKKLVTPSLLGPSTYLVLTNAIYFKANWKWQFDEHDTTEEPFHMSSGTDKDVDMMNMCEEDFEMNYAENDDVQILQLPYDQEELSMYILLPRGNDIIHMESVLTSDYINDLKDDMNGEWVDVSLPRFKFETEYKLNEPLINLGMVAAFGNNADFSGIKDSGSSDLWIDSVVQKAIVEVNEEGTEAAAATAVSMTDSIEPIPETDDEPIVFNADHPFIFMIEHKATGQILFMGKVNDPTS